MATWAELTDTAPALAASVLERFGAHRHAVIATLRRDGSPRLSGIETAFWRGDLWLGMMPGSRKGADLSRDPRFALHSAPLDLELAAGDAKIAGRAEPVTDPGLVEEFMAALGKHAGETPPGEAELFRADLLEVSLVTVDGDRLLIDSWREGEAPRRRTRR